MNTRELARGDPQVGAAPGWKHTISVALLVGLGCYFAQLLSIALRFPQAGVRRSESFLCHESYCLRYRPGARRLPVRDDERAAGEAVQ
jgi:hypothetical protein